MRWPAVVDHWRPIGAAWRGSQGLWDAIQRDGGEVALWRRRIPPSWPRSGPTGPPPGPLSPVRPRMPSKASLTPYATLRAATPQRRAVAHQRTCLLLRGSAAGGGPQDLRPAAI